MRAASDLRDGTLIVLRGLLLAVTSAALTIAVHGAAGGGMPDLGVTLLFTVLVAGAGMTLADRRRSAASILAVLGGSQVAMHALLTMSAGHDTGAAGHAMAGPAAMTVGHVLVTLVLAVVLARVDALLVALASALSTALPRRAPHLPAWSPVGAVVTHPEVCTTTEIRVLLRRVRTRRGPPPGF